MASSAPTVALRFPHRIEESNEGQSHVCTLAVTMPDGSTESFRGKGQSARAARTNATFQANFAINLHAFNDPQSNSSTANVNHVPTNKQQRTTTSSQHPSTAAHRAVDKDPTLIKFQGRQHGKRREAGRTSPQNPPLQSEMQARQGSKPHSDDEAPLPLLQDKFHSLPHPAPPVRFCQPDNEHISNMTRPPETRFHEADDFSKNNDNRSTRQIPQQDDNRTPLQRPRDQSGHAARNPCSLVRAESSDDESSGQEIDAFSALSSPNPRIRHGAKSSPSTHRQLHYRQKNTVDKGESPVTLASPIAAEQRETPPSSAIRPPMQLAKPAVVKKPTEVQRRTQLFPFERVERRETRELIAYSDNEDDDSPHAQETFKFQGSQPSELPGSPLEQGQIMDSRDPSPPRNWVDEQRVRQQRDRGTLTSKKQLEKSCSRSLPFHGREKTPSTPRSGSGHLGEPRIIEPTVPKGNEREGSAISGGNSTEHTRRPVTAATWNNASRAAAQVTRSFPGPALPGDDETGNASQTTPRWITRALQTTSRNANPTWASSNLPPSRRRRYSPSGGNARRRTAPSTDINSTSAGMNAMPINPPLSYSSIPLPPNGQMPVHPPHGPIFPDPRFISNGSKISAPFPIPPPPFFTGPLQHQQFAQLPHSLPGPFVYGPSIGGVSFPFGPNCEQDMEASLARIRRVAIANAQAAVEKDLRNSIEAGNAKGSDSNRDARNVTKSLSKEADVAANTLLHGNQTDVSAEVELSKKRGRCESKNDNDASRKRPKVLEGGELEARRETRRSLPTQHDAKAPVFSKPARLPTPEDVPEGIEHSSGDEIDGGGNISALHELVQRIKVCKSLKYDFDRSIGKNRPWFCTVRVTRADEEVGDKSLKVVVAGRTKQLAKRKASKKMFTVLREMFGEAGIAAKSAKSPSAAKHAQAKTQSKLPVVGCSPTTAAVGALNELWLCKTLENQPDARLQAVDGAMWKCTFLLKVANHGLVRVSEEGPSKKVAKRFAAHKALDVLKELPGSGAGRFSLVKSLAEAREAEAAAMEEIQDERNTAAMEEAVKLSDDENYVAQKQEHFDETDGLFVLPKGYFLTIAQSSADCELWAEKHLKKQSDIGFFLNGWNIPAGTDGGSGPKFTGRDERKGSAGFAVICLSSNEAGLVLRADMCKDSESREFDMFDGLWLPGAVRRVLRDRKLRKHGHEFDLEMVRLWEEHGIRARGVNDVAITSFAVNGFSRSYGNKVLWTIAELNKYWLQKEGVAKSWKALWADSKDAPDSVGKAGNKELGVAALHAYGCLQINERVKVAAKRKRSQLYGAGAEFGELCKRLMHYPFP